MENRAFVERYIYGTKKNEVKWESAPTYSLSHYNCDSIFIAKKEKGAVAVGRSQSTDNYGNPSEDNYYVFILDSNQDLIFTIDKNNISDTDDDDFSQPSPDDMILLSRLYRLASRSAQKIDVLLQQLVAGISEPEDDLPF
ncbi:hypothetical protein [Oscillibacter sp.]|uniref:hypothetical protein n=1 Tax=Oscillibacter sp. TaxID=1945593 RepID=UPI003392F2E8